MKSLVDLLLELVADASSSTGVANQIRDSLTILSRVEHEGVSFLTITLADLGKTFDKSLEVGSWLQSSAFKRRRNESLPAFLQGLTSRVFDVVSGVLLRSPSIEAIEGMRQICRFASKVKMECTDDRRFNAEKKFIKCEEELRAFRPQSWSDRRLFKMVGRILYGRVLSALNQKLGSLELMPRHGPGATEDGTRGDLKYRISSWSRRLETSFSISDYASHNYGEFCRGNWEHVTVHTKEEEPPVRVVFVPKTLRTPRVIAIEPVYNMYTQQSLSRTLVSLLESDKVLRGSLNFTDQTVNANMALESSRTREYATLDLSEASDRVHASLVCDLLADFPLLNRAVFSCRSSKARLPSGKVIPLKKFASMGSALCFPLEAMVFFTITVASIMKASGRKPTIDLVQSIARKVKVYGDDIIIQRNYLDEVIIGLEKAGLEVNRSKTFSNGHFRESCGTDAYLGHNVTPVYVRTPAPTDKRDWNAVASWISLANSLYEKGYWRSCRYVRSLVERRVGFVPHVSASSGILGWVSKLGSLSVTRWNSDLHRFEVKGISLRSRKHKSKLLGPELLLKFFLTKGPTNGPLDSDDPERTPPSFLKSKGPNHLALRDMELTEFTLQYDTVMRRTWAPVY
jgi:hypothetical protein